MTTTNTPADGSRRIGLIELPELAQALTLAGMTVVTGADFRTAAGAIKDAFGAAGAFPIITADVEAAGLRAWLEQIQVVSARAGAEVHVAVIRGQGKPVIVSDTVREIASPTTVNTILAAVALPALAADRPYPAAAAPAAFDVPDFDAFSVPAPAAPVQPAPVQPAPAADLFGFEPAHEAMFEDPAPAAPAEEVTFEDRPTVDWGFRPAAPAETAPPAPAPTTVPPANQVPSSWPMAAPAAPAPAAPAPVNEWSAPAPAPQAPASEWASQAPAAPAPVAPVAPQMDWAAPAPAAPAAPQSMDWASPVAPVAPVAPQMDWSAPAPAAPAEPQAPQSMDWAAPAQPQVPVQDEWSAPAPAVLADYRAQQQAPATVFDATPARPRMPESWAQAPAEDASGVFDDFEASKIRGTGRSTSGLGSLVFVWSGKGGVGKSTASEQLAQLAGEAGLRTILVDGNAGQGDLRTYLRLHQSDLPTIYDAAVGDPKAAVLTPDTINRTRPAGLDEVKFAFVAAPPEDLDVDIDTNEVYKNVIAYARRQADLVIVDTQIIEARDRSGFVDGLIVPALIHDAWGVGVANMSNVGVNNLNSRLRMLIGQGVPADRLMVAMNKVPEEQADDAAKAGVMMRSKATYLGAGLFNDAIRNDMNAGRVNLSNPTLRAALSSALLRVTGNDAFRAMAPAAAAEAKGGWLSRLFGKAA